MNEKFAKQFGPNDLGPASGGADAPAPEAPRGAPGRLRRTLIGLVFIIVLTLLVAASLFLSSGGSGRHPEAEMDIPRQPARAPVTLSLAPGTETARPAAAPEAAPTAKAPAKVPETSAQAPESPAKAAEPAAKAPEPATKAPAPVTRSPDPPAKAAPPTKAPQLPARPAGAAAKAPEATAKAPPPTAKATPLAAKPAAPEAAARGGTDQHDIASQLRADPDGQYYIQVVATANVAGANAKARQLRSLGLPVYTENVRIRNSDLVRVRVGPFRELDSARAARDLLELNSETHGGVMRLPPKNKPDGARP